MTEKTTEKSLRPIDTALADLLLRQFPEASKQHAQLAGLVSYQLADGHLCLPIDKLKQQAKELNLVFDADVLAQESAIYCHAKDTPLVKDLSRLYLHRYWQLEKNISANIHQRLAIKSKNTAEAIAPILAQLFPAKDDKALNGETNWQKVACVLAARQNFSIITGGPGTGKTTTVIKLLALLQTLHYQQNGKYLSVKLAAPTGKAAARLSESIAGAIETISDLGFSEALTEHLPAKASTLHRLLGKQPQTRHFRHNEANPIDAELIVVDEASMIDIDMMYALLKAAPIDSHLILVGDKDQLSSVEAGAVMSELCRDADGLNYSDDTVTYLQQSGCGLKDDTVLGKHPTALAQAIGKLQKCWRAESLSIIELANALNQQNSPAAQEILQSHLGELNRVAIDSNWVAEHLIQGQYGIKALFEAIKANINNQSEELAKTALAALKQQQLLTPLRRGLAGVEYLNQQIRQQAKKLAVDYQFTYGGNEEDNFIGEPILVNKNLYDLGVMNGDVGIVLPNEHNQLRVVFEDGQGGYRWIIPEQLQGNSQGAYAITVHQSQGSEYDRVLLYMPDEWNPVIGKELLYTAVTRAKKQFVLLENTGKQQVFNQAINTKTERYSGLAERLYCQ